MNDGNEIAHDVTITAHDGTILLDDSPGSDIKPRSSRGFTALLTDASDRMIEVHWRRPNGDAEQYEQPIT